jgi:hypothetical protein
MSLASPVICRTNWTACAIGLGALAVVDGRTAGEASFRAAAAAAPLACVAVAVVPDFFAVVVSGLVSGSGAALVFGLIPAFVSESGPRLASGLVSGVVSVA